MTWKAAIERKNWHLLLGVGAGYVIAALVGGFTLSWLVSTGRGRIALGAVLLLPLLVMAARTPRVALLLLLGFLAFLGDFRRLLIPVFGRSGNDPLLLLAPGVVALLVASLLMGGHLRLNSKVAIGVAALSGIMVLQVMNPLQGGLGVGIAGTLFYLVPLLWYWLGKQYGDERLIEVVVKRVLMPVAVLAAVLVVYQTVVGLLPYQQAWVDVAGYASLWVGDTIRPFGFFTSSAECARFLGIAVVVSTALAMGGHHTRGWLALTAVFVVGLFLIGSRGPIVLSSLAIASMWAARGRSLVLWAPRFAIAAGIGGGALFLVLTALSMSTQFEGTVQNVIEHQTSGLLEPTNEEASTAGLHWDMMIDGFAKGLDHPLGLGLGSTTLASGKFGGEGHSSEVDLSDMFTSLGPIGGLLYGVLIIVVLMTAVRVWHRHRHPLALAVLGVLLFTIGSWLRGGEYSIVAIVWLLIGAVDRWGVETETRSVIREAPAAL